MVHVPVEHQDAVHAAGLGVRRGHSHVVEQAEAHRGTGSRVVPRRSEQAQAEAGATLEQRFDQSGGRAGGPACRRRRGRAVVGVRVEPALLAGQAADLFQVVLLMDAEQLLVGRVVGVELEARQSQIGPGQRRPGRLEPLGPLGVLRADRVVSGKERIVGQRERRDRRGGPLLHVRFTPACSNDNLARTSSGTPGG